MGEGKGWYIDCHRQVVFNFMSRGGKTFTQLCFSWWKENYFPSISYNSIGKKAIHGKIDKHTRQP